MAIPVLWKLNLTWQKKANLLVMFCVGLFVIACSLIWLPSLLKLKSSTDPFCMSYLSHHWSNGWLLESDDQAPIAVWTNLEIGVGIICGCLPACRSLLGYLFPSLKMSLRGNTYVYPPQSSSQHRLERKRIDASTQSFIELEEQTESHDELERGTSKGESTETRVDEVLPMDNLGRWSATGYGSHVKGGVRESNESLDEAPSRGDVIVMTKTVKQSCQPIWVYCTLLCNKSFQGYLSYYHSLCFTYSLTAISWAVCSTEIRCNGSNPFRKGICFEKFTIWS